MQHANKGTKAMPHKDVEDLARIDMALKNSNKNMECLCGSGKKFKKCCRAKLMTAREQYRKEHGL
ncbi:SEC-C metal-binding domain-containing protein [Vibrio parahaemolyticus]|uniref:SEC-C metal-binding domain-containing protein n=1 Tax=Vibrio parahaemolyticus TaxID=670 RepID=UPI002F401B5A